MDIVTKIKSKTVLITSVFLTGVGILLIAAPFLINWEDAGTATNAATHTWNMLDISQYQMDADKIEISEGSASLKLIDQTDDDNSIAGFGGGNHDKTLWNQNTGSLELDSTGMQTRQGIFISRIIDAGSAVNWDTINLIPIAPYGKKLPDNGLAETGYSTNNADMTGNIALYHFDDPFLTTTFTDSSSLQNNGSCTSPGCPMAGAVGIFNKGLNFGVGYGNIELGDADNLVAPNLTVETWVKPVALGAYKTIIHRSGSYTFALSNNRPAVYLTGPKTANWYATTSALPQNTWSHIAFTYDGTSIRLYMNGVLARTINNPGAIATTSGKSVQIGSRPDYTAGSAYKFRGDMDEMAIFNRALSSEEIATHYTRGLNGWRLRVRNCTNADCSDASFVGPGEDLIAPADTYYSELSSSTLSLPTFKLNNKAPSQYFQYELTLETKTASTTPSIASVSISPNRYYSTSPTITPSLSSALNFSSPLLGFYPIEKGTGQIYYQITNNGDQANPTWYYWNGNSWTVTANTTDYNSSSTINAAIANFQSQTGATVFSWRAFLVSNDGTDPVGLTSVSVAHNQPPLAPTNLYSNNTNTQDGNPNPIDLTSVTPHFSGIYLDDDPTDNAIKARIQVTTDPTFSDITHWDSGENGNTIASTATGTRVADIIYGSFGTAPKESLILDDGTKTYYWRLQLWDDADRGQFSDYGTFSILDKPTTPNSVSASGAGNDTFQLNWQDLSTNENSFVIERSEDTGLGQGEWQTIATLPANTTAYLDSSTLAGAQYWYRVKAVNLAGESTPASDNISHYTTPLAPTNVFALYNNLENFFNIHYTSLGAENTYTIERCLNLDCESIVYTPIAGSPFSVSPQIDNTANANSRYRYRVRAGADENATSTYSYSDYEFTVPNPPSGLQAQYMNDDNIQLTWQDNSEYESGFAIYLSVDGSEYALISQDTTSTVGQNTLSYTYTQGEKNHSYKFKLRSYIGATTINLEQISVDSNESETIYTLPFIPEMTEPQTVSPTSIQWNFDLPISSTTFISGFHLYSSNQNLVSTLDANSATSITETNLSPNTCYTRQVTAFTPTTESATSTQKMACTPAELPSNVRVQLLGQNSVALTWDVGQNPTTTEFLAENTTNNTSSSWKTNNNWSSTNLTCKNEYSFKVKARNVEGIETVSTEPFNISTLDCEATAEVTVVSSGGIPDNTPEPIIEIETPTATTSTPVLVATSTIETIIGTTTNTLLKKDLTAATTSKTIKVLPIKQTSKTATTTLVATTIVTTTVKVIATGRTEKILPLTQPSLLTVINAEIPKFYRQTEKQINANGDDDVRLLIRPNKPVHSITARIYSENGKKPAGGNTAWKKAFLLVPSDTTSTYQATIDLKNLPEGKYNLSISFNNEDGTKTQSTQLIEVKQGNIIAEKKPGLWIRFLKIIGVYY